LSKGKYLRTAGGFTGVSVELLYRKISTSGKIKQSFKEKHCSLRLLHA